MQCTAACNPYIGGFYGNRDTYIRIVVHIGHQVLDERFQGPRKEVIVVVVQAPTAVL